MNDNDIIKALEICCTGDITLCHHCPLYKGENEQCDEIPYKTFLDLINRQKAEIERLKSIVNAELDTIHDLGDDYERALEEGQELVKTAKSEAIKEFAEEFEKRCISGGIYPAFVKRQLNDVKKEMTENDFKE